ncbi:MAG: hypothetical protein KC731_18250, partial [Myxococcales bacterium]|nr:hypothetical protein [Myxococcales bacterium]
MANRLPPARPMLPDLLRPVGLGVMLLLTGCGGAATPGASRADDAPTTRGEVGDRPSVRGEVG